MRTTSHYRAAMLVRWGERKTWDRHLRYALEPVPVFGFMFFVFFVAKPLSLPFLALIREMQFLLSWPLLLEFDSSQRDRFV